jgi:hypothetical protein
MEDSSKEVISQSPYGVTRSEDLFTPTNISKLALQFLNLTQSDPQLMQRVYGAACFLVGAPQSLLPQAASGPTVVGSSQNPQRPDSLTPDEARKAREEFRLKMGLSTLNPAQAKMATAIAREKKKSANRPASPSGMSTRGAPASPKGGHRGSTVSKDTIGPDGKSKSTWSVKLQSQRQRAIERMDALETEPKNWFRAADFYNARLTLEDTWQRYKESFDSSNKKNPLSDLLPLPDINVILRGAKEDNIQLRKHTTGHFILQDEVTGKSLRPKGL